MGKKVFYNINVLFRYKMPNPRAGVTLALDFAFLGKKTLDLLDELDVIVEGAGGAIYPAKDARMKPGIFLKNYPVSSFEKYIDPHFSSDFWKRMNKGDL